MPGIGNVDSNAVLLLYCCTAGSLLNGFLLLLSMSSRYSTPQWIGEASIRVGVNVAQVIAHSGRTRGEGGAQLSGDMDRDSLAQDAPGSYRKRSAW